MIWLYAFLTGLIGAAFLLVLGRRQHEQQRTRLQVNQELYEQRKLEIEQEQKDGLLTENAARRALLELDKRFISENSEVEQIDDRKVGKVIYLPAALILITTVVLYALFGGWKLQQQADEALAKLPELGRKVMSDDAAATTPAELSQFALGLRQKLMQAPNDPVPWLIYGRVMTVMQQPEQAIEAYEKSLALNPERSATIVSYAELLVNLGTDEHIARAGQLLAQLLQREPNNLEALSLIGLVAYQRSDYAQAISAWQLLTEQVADDSARAQALQAAIADAQGRLAQQQLQLTVVVELAPELATQVPDNATLFVYVRAVDGVPMPAAVVRQAVTEFPVTVTLSSADAMLPDYNLTNLNQWQVQARISLDEQIDREAGDIDADAVVVDAGKQTVTLRLATVVSE